MKKAKNKVKAKRKSNKVRKIKRGRRLAASMVTIVHGLSKRVDRLERLQKKMLDSMGEVGKYITRSEKRIYDLELSWWDRFKNWLTGRKD